MSDSNEDIAIVGMSCLFPEAPTPSQFWENVVHKRDCITQAPANWQPELFYDPSGQADRSYTDRGGFLGDLSRFDPIKHTVPPKCIEGAEPDQFIALRCAWEALNDAGAPEVPVNRERTGVIIGRGLFINRGWASVFQRTFGVEQLLEVLRRLEPERSEEDLNALRVELKNSLPQTAAETVPGLVHSALVGRIANSLDLRGPAFTVDAACSSSLVAVELGMRELRGGQCDAILVGGSQVSTPGPIHILFCYLNALSHTGKIAPFSADADGTLLGQGCGMIVLKRRRDAERDGNRIYALLKSIGVSSDGRGAGLLAPLTEGQQLAIRRAYQEADISPTTVELLEAHGTGIPLGDRTEIESLRSCFPRTSAADLPVALGTVKSMIGHLIPAAGIASIIKTSLALYHRVLPPTLHGENVQAGLELDQTRFRLCTASRPWLLGDRQTPRRAGVNAFGFGGINAHAILEEHPVEDEKLLPRLESNWPAEVVVVSAENRSALSERVEWLVRWIEQADDVRLLDIAAACAQDQGSCRIAFVADSCDDLQKKLHHAAKLLQEPERTRIQDRHGIYWYETPLAHQGRIAFVFPGEGAQYLHMLEELCRHFPEVRYQFDITAAALRQRGFGMPLRSILYPESSQEAQAETTLYQLEVAVAAVTAASRGLLDLLHDVNVVPEAIVGHSSGEFGALLASGAYRPNSEEDLIHSAVAGAESAAQLETSGLVPKASLVAVGGADRNTVDRIVAEANGNLVVAMDNCPHQQVLVGEEKAVEAAVESLKGKGGLCERLSWNRAYHTEAFGPACSILEQFYRQFEFHRPRVELWSCQTASPFPEDPASVREFAMSQWSSPVRFRETIERMHAAGVRLFVEVGPRGNLSAFIADTLAGKEYATVPMDVHRKGGIEQLCKAVAMLAAHGVPIDLRPLFERRRPQPLDLRNTPPSPASPQPVLQLELPVFELNDAATERWSASQGRIAADRDHSNGSGQSNGSSPISANSEQAVSSNGHPPQTPPGKAVDGKNKAWADFQRTMQHFLDVQKNVLTAGNAGIGRRTSPRVQESTSVAGTTTPQESINASSSRTASSRRPSAGESAAAPVGMSRSKAKRSTWPFVDTVLEYQRDRLLIAECELNIEKHRFLQDHTFFGRALSDQDPQHQALPIMPLAMTLEMMAEAVTMLCPAKFVTALKAIKTAQWLAFDSPVRKVRIEARRRDATETEVSVAEADRNRREIARAIAESSAEPTSLGPPRLSEVDEAPPSWQPDELYDSILYHGPAFQGIEAIEKCGPSGLSARLRPPEANLLFRDAQDSQHLILPAALVDTASQIPGVANFRRGHEDGLVNLAFPNTTERLEFVRCPQLAQPLRATVRCHSDASFLQSDVELTTPDGQVVLRYLGRREEVVQFPLSVYDYWSHPRRSKCSREITHLFAEVDGIDHCTVTEFDPAGSKLFVNPFWAEVLSRIALSSAEQSVWRSLKLPPVQAAGWLLGRIAAKDAARIGARREVPLADVLIESAASGQPVASFADAAGPKISIAHKGTSAVAVASRHFSGVGIDIEKVHVMDSHVVGDAFTSREQQLLKPLNSGFVAGWAVKEAVGKALGQGLPEGPRCVEIVEIDKNKETVRCEVKLYGSLADCFAGPARSASPPGLSAYCRVYDSFVLALCFVE